LDVAFRSGKESREEEEIMINGVHALIYSRDADRVRAFFRDVLGRKAVDAGDGWLIFALPPAELAVHPTDGAGHHELYLMCEDIEQTIKELDEKGVRCSPVEDQGWGLVTSLPLPGGDELGLYEPRHDTAIALSEA
jgi:catechol 2,3-dioxygenase-like lactoylglutathione lyase family enzyme